MKREHKFGRNPGFADLVVPKDWQFVGFLPIPYALRSNSQFPIFYF
jgi:hypothetical protein